jgi:predicted restriction endonuclease
MQPDRTTVLRRIRECASDADEFFEKYSSGRTPKAHYLLHKGELYPLKAVWAAAHRPSIHTRDTHTADARRGLRALGFTTYVDADLADQYFEGKRIIKEVTLIARSPQVVAAAKAHHGSICQACGFDFEATYGKLGAGYIECHHIDPLSGRDGHNEPTNIHDLAVLCSNCHRMIHSKRPCLTIDEIKAAIRAVQISN